MNSKIFSATVLGESSYLVDVEINISSNKKGIFIVGLPDATIRESGKRIQSALKSSGIDIHDDSISINLAPAHLRKEGPLFDLPIAIGILHCTKRINLIEQFIQDTLFIGELSFDGTIRPINGALVIASCLKNLNKKRIILPRYNAKEAGILPNIEVIGIENINELIQYLNGKIDIKPTITDLQDYTSQESFSIDFSDVKGQYPAKRALQIAAAGRHNILFSGPPGSGKTMLAKRLTTIMPSMSFEEIIETTKIYSISGKLDKKSVVTERPFRSPHHSSSITSLLGGGHNKPAPGELSLAHKGILFLDELLEFRRDVLESLRQPLESKISEISRTNYKIIYPCDFLLIAALNPCPCGYFGDKNVACTCAPQSIKNYKDKLSGPLIDRIDIKVMVESISYEESQEKNNIKNISSDMLKEGVKKAVGMQLKRFGKSNKFNNQILPQEIDTYCILTEDASLILKDAFNKINMSMRTYHKILKVARTIADIDESELININHIKQAIIFKS